MSGNYTAVEGVFNFIIYVENKPASGTGISPLLRIVHNLLGPNVPPSMLKYSVGLQNNIFGGYPSSNEMAPDIVFAVMFLVIGVIHLGLFLINFFRGHYFWLSLGWMIYAFMRTVGFTLRAVWASDITLLPIGLTSEVFSIVPSNVIVSLNLILAQRLFTWRHPVGGSRRLFWNFMIGMYLCVLLSIGVVIAASFYPYLHFISQKSNDNFNKIVQATSIAIVAYSLTSVCLIALSFWFPTSKDENLYTYQPWWIESFHPFYFVQPGAAQRAEETFMKRNHNHRHAVRVIAATHHHYKMVQGVSNQRGDLKHNVSLLIIIITTILILVGAIGRCIVTFQIRPSVVAGGAAKPIVMFLCWGLFEVVINILYIIGRVDLRFYRPDVLPAKVRAIITADQSYYPSDMEEYDDDDHDHDDDDDNLYEEKSTGVTENQSFHLDSTSNSNSNSNSASGPSITSTNFDLRKNHQLVKQNRNELDSEFSF